MSGLLASVMRGAAAGAAGTTALNAVTYLDMIGRARPASRTPEDTIEAIEKKADTTAPGAEKERENRIAGLGPLFGLLAGVGVGALLGLARAAGCRPGPVARGLVATAGALLAGNGPMTVPDGPDPGDGLP